MSISYSTAVRSVEIRRLGTSELRMSADRNPTTEAHFWKRDANSAATAACRLPTTFLQSTKRKGP
jgi:hypothetical protein